MKKNTGLFDMVLALSINKINSQFDWLLNKKKVSKNWGFLVDKSGEYFINDNKTFADNLAKWKAAFDPKIAAQLKQLQTQIDAAIEAENWVEVKKLQTQKKDLENTQDPKNPVKKYEYALEAKIKCFEVELEKAQGIATPTLYFIIEMESGKLYFKEYNQQTDAFQIIESSFKNCTYAFKVKVGTKIIRTTDMVLSAKDAKALIQEGITDADFEASALFMDFQNANISQYAIEKTTIFKQVNAQVPLMSALTHYFNKLAGTEDNPNQNPFILGYKVEPKNKTLTPALFNPTAIMHSTSDTEIKVKNNDQKHDPNYQAFNYLMQTNKHPLPPVENATRGMLPKSLIEYLDDKSKTTSGVFAIDYNTFIQQYVNEVLEAEVYNQLYQTMRNNLTDYTVSAIGGNAVRCDKKGILFNLRLGAKTITAVTNQESKGLKISWELTINGRQHLEIPRKIGTVDTKATSAANIEFSTEGRFKIVEKGQDASKVQAARKGRLDITLTASKEGQLRLESSYEQPFIGTVTEKPVYESDWSVVINFAMNFGALGLLGGVLFAIFEKKPFYIDVTGADFGKFKIDNFKAFSSRVILPGSNTFTFKTIRLLSGAKDADDAVLFDIAYAPFEE